MVSLFDLLPFYVGAACLGVAWGMRLFDGSIWRWPATVAAGIVGWLFCRLLLQGIGKLLDFHYQKKLRSLTVDEITRQIGDPATPGWSLALLELKTRGEDLTEIRLRLIDLLCDKSGPCRLFASRALVKVFPDDIEKLNGYSPYDPPETCRAKTAILKTTLKPSPCKT
jgi:hypothetical protein